MRRTALILLIPCVLLANAHTPAMGQTRDITREEAASVIDLVLHGRTQAALAKLDSLKTECEGYPLYHIMRGRCLQEAIPLDDSNSDYSKKVAAPALTELDRAIEICSALIEGGDARSVHYLYRGWAWMSKSYVRSMTRNFYTAGREAGRGKNDLEIYLAAYPDDTTANGIMGAFLYFADTVPKAFKFLSKLLRLPSGDRVEGLDRLSYAASEGGPLDIDYQLILYNVYFYFEGRHEEGLRGLLELVDRYPAYARTSIPLSVARPFLPRFAAELDAKLDSTVMRMSRLPASEIDWNALYIIRSARAYGARYCGPQSAAAAFQKIIAEAPPHPDWMEGFVRYELGGLYAWLGKPDQARQILQEVAQNDRYRYHRNVANDMLEDLDEFAIWFEQAGEPPAEEWITAVYRSAPDSLGVVARRFETLASSSLASSFYLAECRLLSGDHERALARYSTILEADAPAWEQTYQMLAAARISEIYAARKEYKMAAKYQQRARGFHHREYLFDWVLDGRKRYFDRLAAGEETVAPSVLVGESLRAAGGSGTTTQPR